jgi:hypothetical protein
MMCGVCVVMQAGIATGDPQSMHYLISKMTMDVMLLSSDLISES